MKKIFPIIAIVLAGMFLLACDPDYREDEYEPSSRYLLSVRNNTDTDILWFVPDHGDVDCEAVTGELPDSLTARLEENFYSAKAHSTNSLYIYDGGDKCPIETYHPEDSVTFYFFDAEVFENNDWKTIVSNELWLARYTYTAQEVIDMDKLITYPAAE